MLYRRCAVEPCLPPLECTTGPCLPWTAPGRNLVFRDRDLVTIIDILGDTLGGPRVVIGLEPLVESALVLVAVGLDGLREDLCALGEAVDIVDAQETETDIGAGIVLGKVSACFTKYF